MTTTKTSYTYEEKNAIALLRNSFKRKPEIASALLDGMSKELASIVLKKASEELTDLLMVSQAFSAAAKKLVELDTPKENDHADS